uniref:Protein kinase domain-containing protein n=1 Tax=Aureoumbra lagunensis TaxID=44058 RepID=A0A7S3K321_9STRA
MDRYHIFNEIGAGRQSQVFKGRCKKTVNYVAIKRVEKGQMEKVVNEVQMMHCLSHPHTLKFYDWYETRNNLWLILEYCSGGDLKSLLRSDGQLPLRSVKLFGGDLLAGLQYLHYSGILYCDLKPSNILIDEYGVLKLAGFGLARKIPNSENRSRAPRNRGTPYYMAPELFLREGVHNYGSDLWSLGVVLYELATGKPPFASASLNELMHYISNTEPDMSASLFLIVQPDRHRNQLHLQQTDPTTNDNCTLEHFSSAISQLLQKDATQRPTWDQLHDCCTISFWHDVIPSPPESRTLAPQPLFEACIAAQRTAAQNGKELGAFQDDQPSPLSTTPNNNQQGENNNNHFTTNTSVQETLRVSTSYQAHMRRNLARRQSSNESHAHNNNSTLNRMDDSDDSQWHNQNNSSGPRYQEQQRVWWQKRKKDPYSFCDNFTSSLVFAALSDSQISPILSASATSEHDALAMLRNAYPNTNFAAACAQHRHHLSRGHASEYTATLLRQLPADVLPLEPKSVELLRSMPHEALEAHLVIGYRALVAATKTTHILAIIAYLQLASEVMHVANVVINSSFVSLLIQMLRTSDETSRTNSDLRSSILIFIGILMRHATYIVPDPDSGLVSVLLGAIGDSRRQAKERELALAALGELAFYVTTQDIRDDEESDPEDDECTQSVVSEDDARWRLFRELVKTLIHCLDSAVDAGLIYYAAKTIGNILAQARPIFVDALAALGQSLTVPLSRHAVRALTDVGSTEPGRVSAYALIHMLRPLVIKSQKEQQDTVLIALEALGGASALAKATINALIRTDDAKWQLTTLNLINIALTLGLIRFQEQNKDLILSRCLASDARLLACLVRALGGGGCVESTVRAKSALAILQIGSLYPPALARATDPTLSQMNLDATRLLDGTTDSTDHRREVSAATESNTTINYQRTGTGNKGTLIVALDRLAAREAHDLANDDYFSECALVLTAFVADTAVASVRCAAQVAQIVTTEQRLEGETILREVLRDRFNFDTKKPGEKSTYKNRLSTDMSLTDDLDGGSSFEDNLCGTSAAESFDQGLIRIENNAMRALGHLPVRELAAVLPLTASAAASPLLRPRVVTPAFLSDLGQLLANVASFDGIAEEVYRIFHGLPEILDALLSRDAELLMPHLAIIFKNDVGLLPASCDLFPNAHRDLRLTAAQLLRHSVPPLLHGMQRSAPDDESLLVNVHDLLANRLPLACVRLLAAQPAFLEINEQQSSPQLNNNLILETECMLRLLLETLPRWPAATSLFANHIALVRALNRTVNSSSTVTTSLSGLAAQLLLRFGVTRH